MILGTLMVLALAVQDTTPEPLSAFWRAATPTARTEAAAGVIASGIPFDSVFRTLHGGRAYGSAVPRGLLEPTLEGTDGHLHRYLLLVPQSYDPSRRYPLRVFLHGGTTVPDPGPGGSWWPDLDLVSGEGHISVMPLAWSECLWWQHGQVEALRHILLGIKRFYNVDENRVYLAGVSDGGAGTYFGAFHDTTPWAAFLPFVGHPGVLENAHYGVDGSTQVANLLNKPLFIVNTIQDPIHPAVSVHPYLELYGKAGVRFDYHELPGVHDVAWWPAEAEDIEAFLAAHPRDPLPDTVVWATEYVDRYNRAHWIVVDELGSASSGAAARRLTGFTSGRNAGIVSAIRDGNTFRVDTHGVRRLRILVSPDEVDLTLPVEVVVNGRTTFHGPLAPDVGTLLAWAAVDGDRTMLFAAEIRVDVPR